MTLSNINAIHIQSNQEETLEAYIPEGECVSAA